MWLLYIRSKCTCKTNMWNVAFFDFEVFFCKIFCDVEWLSFESQVAYSTHQQKTKDNYLHMLASLHHNGTHCYTHLMFRSLPNYLKRNVFQKYIFTKRYKNLQPSFYSYYIESKNNAINYFTYLCTNCLTNIDISTQIYWMNILDGYLDLKSNIVSLFLER